MDILTEIMEHKRSEVEAVLPQLEKYRAAALARNEYKTHKIYPPAKLIFNALVIAVKLYFID